MNTDTSDLYLVYVRMTQVLIKEFEHSKFNSRHNYQEYLYQHYINYKAMDTLNSFIIHINKELKNIFGFKDSEITSLLTTFFTEKKYKELWDISETYNLIEKLENILYL